MSIRVDKVTLKRLRAGQSVEVRHRTKRTMRKGQSYPLEVDGKRNAARVLVATARIKPGSKYIWLLGCVMDNEEPVRYMAAKCAGGELMDDTRDYVLNPSQSFDGEPAVDFFTQRRFSQEARKTREKEIMDLIAAMEEVREALEDRIRANPNSASLISRELWTVRSRIDDAKRKLKRQIAA